MAASVRMSSGRAELARRALPGIGVLLFAASSWAVAAWAGGWGIPHNDDWSPLRIARHLAGTGHFRLLGWNRTALAGQSWPAAAVLRGVGGGVATLQAVDLVAAALVLALAYLLLRRFLAPGWAALGVLPLLGTPELWLLSTSFMTDALAAALVLGSLLLGVVALQAVDRRVAAVPFLGSVLVGMWAFTVREAAIAAPVAVLLAAVLPTAVLPRRRRADLRPLAWPSAVVLGGAVVAFEWWRRSLPAGDEPRFGVALGATAAHALEALFWTGLVLSPLTLCWVARWRSRRTWLAVAGAAGLAAVLRLGLQRPFFPANYLSRRGAYLSAGLGTRAALVPNWLWLGVCAAAVVSAGVLLAWLVDRRARAQPADPGVRVLTAFLAVSLGGLLLEDLVGQTTYSRYLLVLPPVLAVFLLRTPGVRQAAVAPRIGSAALLAALCALAVVLTAGTLRSDAARWRAAEALVARGVDPMEIAAGQEWSGWHTSVVAVHDRRDAPGDQAWWTGMFSDASECWLVAMDPGERAGYRLAWAEDGVWVFRAEAAC
jgi:hypothetical protein